MYYHPALGKVQSMGIATSLDILQKVMNDIFGDLDYVLVYLDDIPILSNDREPSRITSKKVQAVFTPSQNGTESQLVKK